MKNTPQLIGVVTLLTFAVSAMPTQQMFAHPYFVASVTSSGSAGNYSWKTVVISEIMADPSPPRGLPDVEYIELFNRSSEPVLLSGWHFSDASSSTLLHDFVLEPGQYVVIASKPIDAVESNMMVVSGMPSLNNTGDSLRVTDANGKVIDAINYSNDWYRDEVRSNGGWSLELIDVSNTCELAGNWTVSEDDTGGTPGRQNSVYASNPDVTGPYLTDVDVVDPWTIRLTFNERLSAGTANSLRLMITPSKRVTQQVFYDSSRTTMALTFDDPLERGLLYKLSLDAVYDCAGNSLQPGHGHSFAVPEEGIAGDVVINEVLFNPHPDGVDFVEIYNASSKYIRLNGWAIGAIDEDGHIARSLMGQSSTLHPGQYLAFATDLSKLRAQYVCADSSLRQLKLPSYPDNGGIVFIANELDSVIDRFAYSKNFHNPFINDDEGVSLERISAASPSHDDSNWTSGSSSTGFATPGYQNSATRPEEPRERSLTVTPKVFTPMTGSPNFARIAYRFGQSGSIATVNICDSRGVIVRHLVNNELLATEGILRWDGDRDNGTRVNTGYYFIWFQVFAVDGTSRLFREPVAVSPGY